MAPRTCFGEQIRSFLRRPRIVPGRRFCVVAAAAAASLAWTGGVAPAATSSTTVQATIYKSAGGTATATADLASCPSTYTGPSAMEQSGTNGLTVATVGSQAWSIKDVVGCLTPPIPIAAVKQVTIVRSNGSPESSPDSQLAPADLLPGNFPAPDDQAVPVIYDSAGTLTYLRPWRGGTDDDQIDTVNGNGSLQIIVFEGPVIPSVTISASQSTVPAGSTVTFAPAVPGNHPNLTYAWGFGGGASDSTAPSPSVTFANPGLYQVTLQVVDTTTGSPGAAAPITINVTGRTPQGPTPSTSPSTPTGPAGSSGSVPKQGPGRSSSKTTGRPGAQHSTTAAQKHRATSHRAPRPVTGPGAGSASGGGNSGPAGIGGSAGAPSSTPVHGPAGAGNAHSARVDGRLVSDVRLLAPSESPLVHALPSGGTAPVLRRPSAPSAVPAFATAVGIVFLFALGAGRELRWRLDRRALRFGS